MYFKEFITNIINGTNYEIYNSSGQLMIRKEIGNRKDTKISISNFTPGLYLLQILDKTGIQKQFKFLKN